MNKKWLVVFFCFNFISGSSYADEDHGHNFLNITITNVSPNLCKLINYSVKMGYIHFTSSIPEYIPPFTSANPIVITPSYYGEELELSYSCGENKNISFNSKQILKFFSDNELSGQIISANNMTADYQAKLSFCVGRITWNLAVP